MANAHLKDSPRARLLLACLLAGLAACATRAPSGQAPEVLLGEPERTAEPELHPRELEEPVSIGFRAPPSGGSAYRLVVEYSGEHQGEEEGPLGEPAPPARESHLLELEYHELPVAGQPSGLLFALDALHYRLEQEPPKLEREIELGDDRLRTRADGKTVLDLRGAQPQEDLTPRKLLGQVFGSALVDASGSLRGLQPHGAPVARRFLSEFPLARALAYAHPALPEEPVRPGARWRSSRFPVGPAGNLGLQLALDYTLSGFQDLDGVPCAWVIFSAREEGEHIRSAAGFDFDYVVASLDGEAYVEIETSRVRMLRLEDEVRVAYKLGEPPTPVHPQRLRHRSRLRLDLIPPEEAPAREWADGSPRFGAR